MSYFFVNKNTQATGEHEIHRDNCIFLPAKDNRIDLGFCYFSVEAKMKARELYNNVDGCYWCCPEIHKK